MDDSNNIGRKRDNERAPVTDLPIANKSQTISIIFHDRNTHYTANHVR